MYDKQAFINLVVIRNFFKKKPIPCIPKSWLSLSSVSTFLSFFSIYLQKTPRPWSWLVPGRMNSRRQRMLSWPVRSWRSSTTRSTERRSYVPPSWKSWSKPGLKPGRLRRCVYHAFICCLFYESAVSKILFAAALKDLLIGINTIVENLNLVWANFCF